MFKSGEKWKVEKKWKVEMCGRENGLKFSNERKSIQKCLNLAKSGKWKVES